MIRGSTGTGGRSSSRSGMLIVLKILVWAAVSTLIGMVFGVIELNLRGEGLSWMLTSINF